MRNIQISDWPMSMMDRSLVSLVRCNIGNVHITVKLCTCWFPSSYSFKSIYGFSMPSPNNCGFWTVVVVSYSPCSSSMFERPEVKSKEQKFHHVFHKNINSKVSLKSLVSNDNHTRHYYSTKHYLLSLLHKWCYLAKARPIGVQASSY